MNPCIHSRVKGQRRWLGLLSAAVLLTFLLAGCGGQGGGDGQDQAGESIVLATVGDTDITAAMYEKGLKKMEAKDLPTGDSGQPLDTATSAGKNEFLQILINKELLRQKAVQLGYESDPQAQAARASLTGYHAGLALWEEVVGNPANSISEEELQAFYAKMGKTRNCQFVICNFLDDAKKAQDFARGGADWEEVVQEYHDGAPSPNGKYEIKVPYGQYSSSFEDVVFDTPIGQITEPIQTSYGFWVMRVLEEKQGEKPDLESAKAQILDVTRNRKIGRARNDFKEYLRKEHKLKIDEDVLWTCYQGIPDGGLMDPETNAPFAKEDLKPLDVPLQDLGKIFYSYEMGGELKEFTLGDYKSHFDNMSVFQRPKKSDMLGGLREHLIKELERGFVNEEAEKRGLDESPEVQAQVTEKVEEVMVTKLYGDVVTFDDRVTPEDIEAFYAEHQADYQVPETRQGRLVICLNEADAAQAMKEAAEGASWRMILKKYGSDRDNKSRGGKLPGVPAGSDSPVTAPLFALDQGQVSQPFALDNGRFGVVKLEGISEAHVIPKDDVIPQLGQRIKATRKEEAFQNLLTKWGSELGIARYEENLTGLASWEELQRRPVPENLVPRNDPAKSE